MSANRLATLLGALILASLLVYLLMAFRGRQPTMLKTKRAKAPKVQPKYSPQSDLNELSNPRTIEQSSLRESAPDTLDRAAAGAAPQDQPWTRPTIVSPTPGNSEQSSEEEEREVFEL
jgi:hypothetical protein